MGHTWIRESRFPITSDTKRDSEAYHGIISMTRHPRWLRLFHCTVALKAIMHRIHIYTRWVLVGDRTRCREDWQKAIASV